MRTAFMEMLGLSAPILQAPIGSCATPALAVAVGRAGGMGSMSMAWTDKETGLQQLASLKAQTQSFFFNFVLRFGAEAPPWYIGSGLPAVTFSWGLDAPLIAAFKKHGTRVGVQVGSSEGARLAIAAGADFIIAQGMEAGGHVQSTTPLDLLLKTVIAAAGQVPVVATGGIATAEDIVRVMKAGAQAVMMGTRFVATAESGAHDLYKQALVAAKREDQAYTHCFDIDWPYAMHGVLRNSTFKAWEAAGHPMAPHRPGEGDIVIRRGGRAIVRYCDSPPAADAEGDILAACLYAGTSVAGISDVRPAGEIVQSLWAEAQKLL
ncbi:NAD(P)H-dependent flavin oxidoreductase [Aestuariivirga litoralis]|uniref:NAD(P)H-dependent flavin oxidoreductase n=1 Tax=Aestuariivirga litoralis TaxID=2650924 RepID=UPI0018C62F35|nr:nitronate monooxygenase [Aestuariivirga litoralis]MBG1231202.1 nitronate monooxygenase [Aestuariivirga litoralis]